ncbi:uncharacterized protein L969DRAFT_54466 [Mixia osmundae IAM 14324]|uniref:SH3 domain-containing protein n=1 Tax=Mixia osmundae (strain CBS 9802 / IAM 14324 / JCM 22182 / KY 12970) TaxID=764103 RepID=G7E1S5_MIXOS|nr:uncharacterized protein L969DRAFT_54466 [Mixia osmundae IAM 14324]KEI36734.1 hypothetical protein L969DRAFT_54466 [Mixia osmundae IAM 14324]GAA96785.1 hypothetical protein E5Q_03456 [Mixia osmundae IAM 14324]
MFASLTQEDRQAFFDLLDEYFASRPHLLAGSAGDDTSSAALGVLASQHGPALANHAMRNPAATSSALKAGGMSDKAADSLSRFGSKVSAYRDRSDSNPPAAPARHTPPPAPSAARPPAPPPRTNSGPTAAPPAPAASHGGLQSGRSFGGMNVTSGKAALNSVMNYKKDVRKDGPTIPFVKAKPVSTTLAAPAAALGPAHSSAPIAPPPVRRGPVPPPPVHVTKGIGTVEALYDYEATDAGDLPLREGAQVTLLERVNDEWLKGEDSDGKTGIFPATYVKELYEDFAIRKTSDR